MFGRFFNTMVPLPLTEAAGDGSAEHSGDASMMHINAGSRKARLRGHMMGILNGVNGTWPTAVSTQALHADFLANTLAKPQCVGTVQAPDGPVELLES